MSVSVRELANCIGLGSPARLSLRDDFLGTGALPTRPEGTALRRHLHCLAHGNHFHVHVFFVEDPSDPATSISAAQRTQIRQAVQVAREIWLEAGLTIGCVRITQRNVGDGLLPVTSGTGAFELVHEIDSSISGIEVLVLQSLFARGHSPTPGPPFNTANWMQKDALLIRVQGSVAQDARTMAHEIGHYLGLYHVGSFAIGDNLMTPSNDTSSTRISTDQANFVKGHGYVKGSCK